jgi:hypothetical protein
MLAVNYNLLPLAVSTRLLWPLALGPSTGTTHLLSPIDQTSTAAVVASEEVSKYQ